MRQVDSIQKSINDDVMGIFTYATNLDFDFRKYYISGQWSSATVHCTEFLNIIDNNDESSTNLIDIMSSFGYKVPDN